MTASYKPGRSLYQHKPDSENQEKLILTAASQSFGPSLLALLGSLTLNWPEHPPVLVYDLGMDQETLARLEENEIPVKKVPPFVPHWRKHFTWKIWCWNDATARDIYWIDAGTVVLRPLDDVFAAIDQLGYFITPTYYLLSDCATDLACVGCGVDLDFRNERMTFDGGRIGFRKEGLMDSILKECLKVASIEDYIKSTQPLGRHDQAIFSLLLYKYISTPIMLDGMVYAGWESPQQVYGQKVWVHRRTMTPQDMEYFAQHISTSGMMYQPSAPPKIGAVEMVRLQMKAAVKKPPKEIFHRIVSRLFHKPRPPKYYDGVRD